MSKFIAWLKSLFIHSPEEKTEMTDQVVEVTPAAVTTTDTATAITPAAEVKTGVADFETALKFVEDGVTVLGDAAKDELKALAKKYL
jgi:hypothetical protein